MQVSTVRDSAGKSQVPDKQGSQIMILFPHPIPVCDPFCFVQELPGQEVGTQLEILKAGTAAGECGGSQTQTRHQDKIIHCKLSVMSGHMGSSWAFLGVGVEADIITAPWNLPGMGIKRYLQWEGRNKNRGEERRRRGSTLFQLNLLEKSIMPY